MKVEDSTGITGRTFNAMRSRVRAATLDDLPTLVALNAYVQAIHADALPELFRKSVPPAEVAIAFKAMLEQPSALWLLAEATQPCGYIYAQFRERAETWSRPAHRACVINHLSVRPEDRRKGVGRALVDAVIAEARAKGFTRIEIDAWTFNHAAGDAFRRMGFEVFNERMALTVEDGES